jgi:methionine synthase I (cobalamin-dependent)
MGTLLYSLGVVKGHCFDELSLSNPELISSIHKGYIDAGADIITTNTFGANKHILDTYFDLGDKVYSINFNAARLAKKIREILFLWQVLLVPSQDRWTGISLSI